MNLLVVLAPGFTLAQESFLKLDSIMVIEKELITTISGYYNNEEIGRDTLTINVGQDQYVKVRKVSFTIVAPNLDVSFNSSLDEFSIGTPKNNWFNALTYSLEKVQGGYQNSGHSLKVDEISLKTLKLESYPNEFLVKNETCFINYQDRTAGYQLFYRIELIYYSHD